MQVGKTGIPTPRTHRTHLRLLWGLNLRTRVQRICSWLTQIPRPHLDKKILGLSSQEGSLFLAKIDRSALNKCHMGHGVHIWLNCQVQLEAAPQNSLDIVALDATSCHANYCSVKAKSGRIRRDMSYDCTTGCTVPQLLYSRLQAAFEEFRQPRSV
jgi:hypothetical protein